MRKLIILLILLLPTLAFAQGGMGMGPGPGVMGYAPSCGQVASQETNDTSTALGFDTTTDRVYVAGDFTGVTATVKKVSVYLKRTSTATQILTLAICTDNAGKPSATCTNADATLDASTLSTSLEWKTFNIAAGYSVSAASRYWIRLYASAVDTTKYANVGFNSAPAGTAVAYSADGSTWSNQDSSAQINFKLNTCAP